MDVISPSATLIGTLVGQAWVESLSIQLTATDTGEPIEAVSVTTNISGQFQLTGITPGTYDIFIDGEQTLPILLENIEIVEGDNIYPIDPPPVKGDIDDNHVIDTDDVSILAIFMNQDKDFNPAADLNKSGAVEIADFALLQKNFLQRWPPVARAANRGIRSLATQQLTADVAFEDDVIHARAGHIMSIPVYIDPSGGEVSGVTTHFEYNPAELEVVDITLTSHMPQVFTNRVDAEEGRILVTGGNLFELQKERFLFMSLTVRLLEGVEETTITPLTDQFPNTNVVGPAGGILNNAQSVTVKPAKTVFLPLIGDGFTQEGYESLTETLSQLFLPIVTQ
ncbi:MAG: hypothetical protein AAF639_32490 [Chloroflexota bacterium]